MDNFMDKLAQKLGAQDMIRANAQAEAAELRRLQMQLETYDECLQEMRKLNLRNVELNEKAQRLVDESIKKIDSIPENSGKQEELLAEVKTSLEGLSNGFEDFVHRENVKVYRNIQAAVTDELKSQTEFLVEQQKMADKKNAIMKPMLIATLAFAILNAGIVVVNLLIALGII